MDKWISKMPKFDLWMDKWIKFSFWISKKQLILGFWIRLFSPIFNAIKLRERTHFNLTHIFVSNFVFEFITDGKFSKFCDPPRVGDGHMKLRGQFCESYKEEGRMWYSWS